jgi:hypothetical protein
MKLTPMYDCPKFSTCGANICPLDPDWHLRTHIQGERVCFMLNEAVKADAERIFTLSHRDDLYLQVIAVMPYIQSRWGAIRRGLEKAAQTGSKMKSPPKASSDSAGGLVQQDF